MPGAVWCRVFILVFGEVMHVGSFRPVPVMVETHLPPRQGQHESTVRFFCLFHNHQSYVCVVLVFPLFCTPCGRFPFVDLRRVLHRRDTENNWYESRVVELDVDEDPAKLKVGWCGEFVQGAGSRGEGRRN